MKYLGRGFFAVAGLLTVLLLAGCRSTYDVNKDPLHEETSKKGDTGTWPTVQSPDSTGAALRIGDEVDVTFINVPSYTAPIIDVIKDDGSITLIHEQKFQAAGKSLGQLREDITKRYVPQFYVSLDFTIATPKRTFSVGGQVRGPGSFQYPNRMDVLQAINMAGGLTEFASHTLELTRAEGGKPEKVNYDKALKDSKYNKEIFPGDRLNVPSRPF